MHKLTKPAMTWYSFTQKWPSSHGNICHCYLHKTWKKWLCLTVNMTSFRVSCRDRPSGFQQCSTSRVEKTNRNPALIRVPHSWMNTPEEHRVLSLLNWNKRNIFHSAFLHYVPLSISKEYLFTELFLTSTFPDQHSVVFRILKRKRFI